MSEISGIAVFRHPHSDEVTLVVQQEGTPAELLSCAELNARRGFVIAPFEVKPEQPILLIRPDRMEQLSLAALADLSLDIPITNSIGPTGATRTHYAIDFASEHAQLELGTFHRLLKQGLNELLEASLPDEVEKEILDVVSAFPDVSDPHHLRTRRIGSRYAIELHIRMDGTLSLAVTHARACEIEQALKNRFGNHTHITLHVEPKK